MNDLTVVCSLDPAARAARKAGLLAELLRQAAARDDLPDGYRFTFPPSTERLALIAQAIDAERQCCRFLRFQLTVEPAGGAVTLELTGPQGTRDVLDDFLS